MLEAAAVSAAFASAPRMHSMSAQQKAMTADVAAVVLKSPS